MQYWCLCRNMWTFFITFPLHIMKHLMRCPVISFITVECRFCVFLLDVTVKSFL